MRMSEIHVFFEKRVSDGNFGGEASRIDLTAQLETTDDPMLIAEALQLQARGRVMADLSRSGNTTIRRQVVPQLDMPRIRAAAQEQTDLEELPDFEEVHR